MRHDDGFGWEYRAHIADLQDIAAMDRLAAELAPPSALRRWAAQRAVRSPLADVRYGIGHNRRRPLSLRRSAGKPHPSR